MDDEQIFVFQSPSLRGSGRFRPRSAPTSPRNAEFQSPSLRGSGRFRMGQTPTPPARGFQSPSLRGSGRFSLASWPRFRARACFNPLHCGAVVASKEAEAIVARLRNVLIPFIAGQWSLLRRALPALPPERVSIPFIAGQWSLQQPLLHSAV